MKKSIFGLLALMFSTLACMGPLWTLNPNSPEFQGTMVAQEQINMQQTLVAAQAGYLNAESTAVINNSSDSPQGGVNIYLQGFEDGEQEGIEDTVTTTTIKNQQVVIAGQQVLMIGGVAAFIVFLLFLVFRK